MHHFRLNKQINNIFAERQSSIPLDIWRQTGKFTECNAKLTVLLIINNVTTIERLSLSSIQQF